MTIILNLPRLPISWRCWRKDIAFWPKKTAEGEMTCYPLHDENRNKYADSDSVENATDAVLTGSEGEVYVYEPHYWYKGVTDVLNQCLCTVLFQVMRMRRQRQGTPV